MDVEFLDMMPDTAKFAPWASEDGFGDASYGADVSVRVRVEPDTHMIITVRGEQVVSTAATYLHQPGYVQPDGVTVTPTVGIKDRITLPDGSQPRILRVDEMRDDKGVFVQVVYT